MHTVSRLRNILFIINGRELIYIGIANSNLFNSSFKSIHPKVN